MAAEQHTPPLLRDPPTVRMYPELYWGARRAGHAVLLETWEMLGALDQDGRGWLSVQEARAGLQRVFGLSRATAYRRLAANPDERFWRLRTSRGERRLVRASLAQVHAVVAPTVRLRRPRDVRLEDFAGVAGRRAAHFAAHLHARANPTGLTRPLARATLQRHTGVSPATQQRYTRSPLIRTVVNVAEEPAVHTPEERRATGRWLVVRTDPDGTQRRVERRRIALAYRVAGVSRGGRATLARLSTVSVPPTPPAGRHAGGRRYYVDLRAALRDRRVQGERYVWDPSTGSAHRHVWQAVPWPGAAGKVRP